MNLKKLYPSNFKLILLLIGTTSVSFAESLRLEALYFKDSKSLQLHMTSSHGMQESRRGYLYNWYQWELDLSDSKKSGMIEVSKHKEVFSRLHRYIEEQIGTPRESYRTVTDGSMVRTIGGGGGRGDIKWPFEETVSWDNVFYLYSVALAMNGYAMTLIEENESSEMKQVVYWFKD